MLHKGRTLSPPYKVLSLIGFSMFNKRTKTFFVANLVFLFLIFKTN